MMLRYFPTSLLTTSQSAEASGWKINFPPHCTMATSSTVRVVSARSTYFLLILVVAVALFRRAQFWLDTLSILFVLFSFMTNVRLDLSLSLLTSQ
jgi:hypothetical protein